MIKEILHDNHNAVTEDGDVISFFPEPSPKSYPTLEDIYANELSPPEPTEEDIRKAKIEAEIERIVDTRGIPYAKAREWYGLSSEDETSPIVPDKKSPRRKLGCKALEERIAS